MFPVKAVLPGRSIVAINFMILQRNHEQRKFLPKSFREMVQQLCYTESETSAPDGPEIVFWVGIHWTELVYLLSLRAYSEFRLGGTNLGFFVKGGDIYRLYCLPSPGSNNAHNFEIFL